VLDPPHPVTVLLFVELSLFWRQDRNDALERPEADVPALRNLNVPIIDREIIAGFHGRARSALTHHFLDRNLQFVHRDS